MVNSKSTLRDIEMIKNNLNLPEGGGGCVKDIDLIPPAIINDDLKYCSNPEAINGYNEGTYY